MPDPGIMPDPCISRVVPDPGNTLVPDPGIPLPDPCIARPRHPIAHPALNAFSISLSCLRLLRLLRPF
eukprot:181972-Rhodomonas_salina.1